MVEQWRGFVKNGQVEMKKAIDEGFRQSEALLAEFDPFAVPKEKAAKA